MTNDLDSLLKQTPAELEAIQAAADEEFAKSNRPRYMLNPIEVEGDYDGTLYMGSEANSQTGQEYPRICALLTNCSNFKIAANQSPGIYKDGQDYEIQMRPPNPESKRPDYAEWGMMVLANGAPLETFKGRVRLIEQAKKPFKTAEGFKYFYKWNKIGASATAKPTEPSELGLSCALALLKGTPVDRDGAVQERWTRGNYGYWAGKTPGVKEDSVLIGKIADGSYIRGLIDDGTVIDSEDGLIVAESMNI